MAGSEEILRRIEESGEQYWIVGPETGRILNWLLRVWRPEVVLEIGTSVGYSAIWIASALRANGKGKLWTVESHKERHEKARANIEEAGLSEFVVLMKGHAPEIFAEAVAVPAMVDFAFFDATKMEHRSYFDAVYPRMRVGGLIVVDNVLSHREKEMLKFIEFMHKNSDLEVLELNVGSGLLLAKVH
ncbi:class I SAM-dependent methyltransferase [Patescibacteria group bacterium]|nr:class I SAM-dependent methyltransferase [Patescibacteria group bacterium]